MAECHMASQKTYAIRNEQSKGKNSVQQRNSLEKYLVMLKALKYASHSGLKFPSDGDSSTLNRQLPRRGKA